jgi:hypothetical protein
MNCAAGACCVIILANRLRFARSALSGSRSMDNERGREQANRSLTLLRVESGCTCGAVGYGGETLRSIVLN